MAENPTWALVIEGFEIEQVERSEQGWLIHARSTQNEHRCPCCGVDTRHVHSYYHRQLRDLSVDGEAVRLRLAVKRMRCLNTECQRKTFAESIDPLAGAYQHLTRRFVEALRAIGLALNGEGGARLAQRLHLPTSGDTILKIVRLTPEPTPSTLRALGVDDWAQTKCRLYGTILVDLEAHRVVDVLQDRTADVVRTWLEAHPGLEVITRDRSTEYARGIAAGAPSCQQVADRWHLLHNVSEALERFLQRIRPNLESLYREAGTSLTLSHYDRSRRRWRGDDRAAQAARTHRQRFYATVQRLKRQGFNILQISRKLGCTWTKVRDFYYANYANTCPERRVAARRSSKLDPFVTHLAKRWDEWCRNAQQLWREIRQQGFKGSHRMVTLWAQARRDPTVPITGQSTPAIVRRAGKAGTTTRLCLAKCGETSQDTKSQASLLHLPSNRELVWAVLGQPSDCAANVDDQQALNVLSRNTDFKCATTLAQRFTALVRNGQPRWLNRWLREAVASGIEELASLATGLRRDFDAVYAAVATHWSNAQSEGQITRLKLNKRLMYGRAKLDLLRIRCLHPV